MHTKVREVATPVRRFEASGNLIVAQLRNARTSEMHDIVGHGGEPERVDDILV